MTKGYKHLTYEQRCQISILKTRGGCPSKIAKTLGAPRSKVTRELNRNSEGEVYSPEEAQKKTENRRKRSPAKKMSPDIIAVIEENLRLNWSPEQISGCAAMLSGQDSHPLDIKRKTGYLI